MPRARPRTAGWTSKSPAHEPSSAGRGSFESTRISARVRAAPGRNAGWGSGESIPAGQSIFLPGHLACSAFHRASAERWPTTPDTSRSGQGLRLPATPGPWPDSTRRWRWRRKRKTLRTGLRWAEWKRPCATLSTASTWSPTPDAKSSAPSLSLTSGATGEMAGSGGSRASTCDPGTAGGASIVRCTSSSAIGHAATGGVVGLRLYVERENATAQRTYAALGMRETPYLVYEEALR